MIKLESIETSGWEATIRGMRNPMNSWEKSDTVFLFDGDYYDIRGNYAPGPHDYLFDVNIGPNDLDLAKRLSAGGPVHGKFKRMIVVTMDITAPLYWWKEFDTYKVGTVANSCSTMHKIHEKEFTMEDFSTEHLIDGTEPFDEDNLDICFHDCNLAGYENECLSGSPIMFPVQLMEAIIDMLNSCRDVFLETHDKRAWWQMIQLLPTSYNQKRTVMLNYEVLTNIYHSRKDHKLDEWRGFCSMIWGLPYAKELIIGEETK